MLTDEMKKSIEEIVSGAIEKFHAESKEDETVEKSETEEEEKEEKVEKSEEEASKEETSKEEEVEKSEDEENTEEETVEKGVKSGEAPKECTPENGGKDQMKSGSPHQETQKMMKSLDELAEILPADEVELIAAWREENKTEQVEDVAKSQSGLEKEENTTDIAELIKSAVQESNDKLMKAINDKDDIIKSLEDKVEKMASAPAYDKRSVDSLEVIEKSGDSKPETISKSQVLDTMLDLQKSGKDVTSLHISEYEATGNISNQRIRNLVQEACKKA